MGCCVLCAFCLGVLWDVAATVLASSVSDVAASSHGAHVLCRLSDVLCGLQLAKIGNEDRERER